MDYSVSIEKEDVGKELWREFEVLERNYMGSLAENLDDKMAEVILLSSPSGNKAPGGGRRSIYGQAPAIESRELLTTLQSKLVNGKIVELEMAEHGFYLDPIFTGLGKGGGYLNRPFVEKGLEKTFVEAGQTL